MREWPPNVAIPEPGEQTLGLGAHGGVGLQVVQLRERQRSLERSRGGIVDGLEGEGQGGGRGRRRAPPAAPAGAAVLRALPAASSAGGQLARVVEVSSSSATSSSRTRASSTASASPSCVESVGGELECRTGRRAIAGLLRGPPLRSP